MITWFRNLARTWVAKLLFVLLILSFAIWGIEDVVRNLFRETAVVRLEGGTIEVPEAQAAARRELSRIQRQLGPAFEADEPIRRAVAAQALEGLIAERALQAEAARMGVATPEAAVRDYVFAIPAFQLAGQFDRRALDQFLRQSDLNEAQFLQIVRDDLKRMQLAGAVRAGAVAPGPLARALMIWERERRVAQVAEFPLVEAPEPEAPTTAQLERFHANNPDRFSSPEMREALLASLSPAAVADQVEVTPEEVRAAYEARRAEFVTPERRDLQQALLPSAEAATRLAETWRGGAPFPAIERAAQEAGGTALALPNLTRDELPIPALGEAVFAAPQGGVTAPVQSPFGWHVMRVERITPGATVPPEQAEARLRADIAAEKAGDLAFERANRVEDAIAGGATLAEAAARYGMSVAPVTLDARGNDASGAPVPLPVPPAARSEAIRAIFAAQPGAAPRLTETRDGSAFLAAELRSVTPPALRPLAEVEEEVRLAYLNDARRRHQEAAASALLAQVRGGQALATAAARSERFGAFGREAERGAAPGTSVPPELLPALFNLRPGEATMVPTRDGFAVAQLLEVVPADPAADPAALATMTREIQSSAADDLEAQYAAALRRRAEPRINPSLMQQVVP